MAEIETYSSEPTSGLDYNLVLPEFEGPLDLLLHLVRKHELDVFNIPISFITTQYLLALEQMQAMSKDMDLASEYLLMAATLAYIKSRELLPPEAQPQLDEVEADGIEEGDPRETLVRRLLAYQKFKAAAAELALRPVVGRNVWMREVPPELSVDGLLLGPAPLAEVPVWELIDLLAKLHGRRQRKLTHEVTIDRLSLADRINEISERLEQAPLLEPVLSFEFLLSRLGVALPAVDGKTVENAGNILPSGDLFYQIVVTFLALLEMARLRLVSVYQAQELGVLYITRPGTTIPDATPPAPIAQPELIS